MTADNIRGACCNLFIIPELCGVRPNLFGCNGECLDDLCWDRPERCVNEPDLVSNPDCDCIEDPGNCCQAGTCCPRNCDFFGAPSPGAFPDATFNQVNTCMPNASYCRGSPGLPCEPPESGAIKRPYIPCELAPGVSVEDARATDCINIPFEASGCDFDGDGAKDRIVFKYKIPISEPEPIGDVDWPYCYWLSSQFVHRFVRTCEPAQYHTCIDDNFGPTITESRTCLESFDEIVPTGEEAADWIFPSCFNCCTSNCGTYCNGYDPCLYENGLENDPCQDLSNLLVTVVVNDNPENLVGGCACLCFEHSEPSHCTDCGFNIDGPICVGNPEVQLDECPEDQTPCPAPGNPCPDCFCQPSCCCPTAFDGYWTNGGGCRVAPCTATVCVKRPSNRGCSQDCLDFFGIEETHSDNFCCNLCSDGVNPCPSCPAACDTCADVGSPENHWIGFTTVENQCGGCTGDPICDGGVIVSVDCVSTSAFPCNQPGVPVGTIWSLTATVTPSFCCRNQEEDCLNPECGTGDRTIIFFSNDEDNAKCPSDVEDWVLCSVGNCLSGGTITNPPSRVTNCP